MKTDKSPRFVVTNEEEYKRMGMKHVSKDRKISRREKIEIDRKMSGHCMAWCKIWNSGKDQGHGDRIMDSKKSKSENLADLSLAYKDHKQEPGSTRPIATGCTSNTIGMSNCVSDLLEAVANSEPDPYEAMSSEDMLYKTKLANEKIRLRRERWEEEEELAL